MYCNFRRSQCCECGSLRYMTNFELYSADSYGFATYLVDHHQTRLRYATDTDRFYRYTGTHWQEANRQSVEVRSSVNRAADYVRKNMPPRPEKDDPAFYGWSVQAAFVKLVGTSPGVSDVLGRLKDDPRIWCQLNDFAAKPHLVNFRNGTIHLDMPYTGPDDEDEFYFRPHDPQDMLANVLAVDYPEFRNPSAPLWSGMLMYMCGNDTSLAQNLESALAYGLLGSNPEQLMVMLVGSAAIGKTQILEIVTELAGSLGGHGKVELIQKAHGIEHDTVRADLRGKNFVMLGETAHSLRMDVIKFKDLTGSQYLPTRQLMQQPVQTKITWTLYCATNDLPDIPGEMDDAIARRLWIFPLPALPVPASKRDTGLTQKIIRQEGPSVLYRLVRHLSAWYSEGGRISKHPRCEAALDKYRVESNTVQQFVMDCLKEDPDGWVRYADLHMEYRKYCQQHGLTEVSKRQLPKRVNEIMMSASRDSSNCRLKGVSVSYAAPSWN